MRRLQVAATNLGSRLFRQNTGMGWTGNTVDRITTTRLARVQNGDVVIRNARPFHSGFPGWSDLGGWSPIVIIPDMVGKTFAIYTVAEVKERAPVTKEQLDFIAAVNAAGGRAGVVHNEKELAAVLGICPDVKIPY